LATSARTGEGIESLWSCLLGAAGREELHRVAAMGVLLNARHQRKLMKCRGDLTHLQSQLQEGSLGDEVVATLLAAILAELGEISGREFTENLLDEIFSRFCIGK
jgi:tRNA modification GTPase